MPPVPIVSAVSGAETQVLEAAVGNVNRIYIVVPTNGAVTIAQGGIFSYYEFKQERSNRLTDETWREKLVASPPEKPAYTQKFQLLGGSTNDPLVFRIGDYYIITEAGGNPPLNVRAAPSRSSNVVKTLDVGMYIHITDGPVKADGMTW